MPVATIPVGTVGASVAFDTETRAAYVVNCADNTVSVIDTVTQAVVGVLTVGQKPTGMAADASTGTLFVAAGSDNAVSVTAPRTSELSRPSQRACPAGGAVDPGIHRIYVSNADDDSR